MNQGNTYSPGDILTKTEDQLGKLLWQKKTNHIPAVITATVVPALLLVILS
jgi:hypothetical protein